MTSSARRIALFGAGAIIYGGVAIAGVVLDIPHHQFWGALLQFAVLLPACAYALYSRRPELSNEPVVFSPRIVRAAILAFFVAAAALSWQVSRGMLVTDENAYRFEARALAEGQLSAPAPPGSVAAPQTPPWPLVFSHAIYRDQRWYFHFAPGWPLVLSVPERLGLGWLANPLLAVALLLLIGAIARDVFGDRVAHVAVLMAALSPYVLSNVVGRMSHGLSAVLIAGAVLAFARGVRTSQMRYFVTMFVLLIFVINVRILTGALAAAVLGLAALIMVRRRPPLLLRLLAVGTVAGIIAVTSVAVYNYTVTGNARLSPYALSRGMTSTSSIFADPMHIVRELLGGYRGAVQGTVLYAFPFAFVLAGYGFLRSRKTRSSAAATVLLAIFIGLFVVNLLQSEGLSSIAGERYWFEGYAGIVILAAAGLIHLIDAWRPSRGRVMMVLSSLALIQTGMGIATAVLMDRRSAPQRKVLAAANDYRMCKCAVFIRSDAPDFPQHFILNNPDWTTTLVFYANDPGPEERARWASILGKPNWVVIQYDPASRLASVVATNIDGDQSR